MPKRFSLFIFLFALTFVFLLPVKHVYAGQTSEINFVLPTGTKGTTGEPPLKSKQEVTFNVSSNNPLFPWNKNYTTVKQKTVINNLAWYNKYTVKLSAPFSSKEKLTFDGGKNATFVVTYTPPAVPSVPSTPAGPSSPATSPTASASVGTATTPTETKDECTKRCEKEYQTAMGKCDAIATNNNYYDSYYKKQCKDTAKARWATCLKCDSKTAPAIGTNPSSSPAAPNSTSSTENQIAFNNTGEGSSEFSSTMTAPTLTAYGYDDEPSTGWKALGKKIMDILGWVAGTVFVGVLLIGAVMYIVAGGDETKAESAKKAIYGAIIGIAIVAFAWTIVTFIAGEFSPLSSSSPPAEAPTGVNTPSI